MPATTIPQLVSVFEAAKHVGCNPATIRRRIDAGDLKAYRLAYPKGHLRVDMAEVEQLLIATPATDKASA